MGRIKRHSLPPPPANIAGWRWHARRWQAQANAASKRRAHLADGSAGINRASYQLREPSERPLVEALACDEWRSLASKHNGNKSIGPL